MPLVNESSPVEQMEPASLDGAANAVNVSDFHEMARQRLPRMVYNYIAGAAGDEISLGRNRAAFDELLLKPRVLRDVSRLDTTTEVFGQRLKHPILRAPTAYHLMAHPAGEPAA